MKIIEITKNDVSSTKFRYTKFEWNFAWFLVWFLGVLFGILIS